LPFYIKLYISGPLDQKEQGTPEREKNGEEIPKNKDLEEYINQKGRLPMDPRTLVPSIILQHQVETAIKISSRVPVLEVHN
jgi:hypothetical protein